MAPQQPVGSAEEAARTLERTVSGIVVASSDRSSAICSKSVPTLCLIPIAGSSRRIPTFTTEKRTRLAPVRATAPILRAVGLPLLGKHRVYE